MKIRFGRWRKLRGSLWLVDTAPILEKTSPHYSLPHQLFSKIFHLWHRGHHFRIKINGNTMGRWTPQQCLALADCRCNSHPNCNMHSKQSNRRCSRCSIHRCKYRISSIRLRITICSASAAARTTECHANAGQMPACSVNSSSNSSRWSTWADNTI